MLDLNRTANLCVIVATLVPFAFWLTTIFRSLRRIWAVLQELRPNGGSTVKDRVEKLENSQRKQTESLAALTRSQADQTKTLGMIEQKLNCVIKGGDRCGES